MKNDPNLWLDKFPIPQKDGNKYSRGHAIICGGDAEKSGAAKLAALSALRIGAGLVTITCQREAAFAYAPYLESVMLKLLDETNPDDFKEFISDERKTAILVGPGGGLNENTKNHTLNTLKLDKNTVIDADAITIFQDNPQILFDSIKNSSGNTVLTPHEGEFVRIFDISGSKEEKTTQAAQKSGAIVLLKGSETIIADPNGNIVINDNAPPTLATAGSGDVLAGMISGLLAQNMPAFDAVCAASWIHGEIATKLGAGMISEDLPKEISAILNKTLAR